MMSNKTLGRVLGVAVAAAAMSQTAQAALVWIDPDGPAGVNPPVLVGSIDLLPGNALNKNVLLPNSTQFTNYYQARVGAFLDANNNVIPVVGLNDPASPNHFEITVVAQFDLTVTSSTVGPGTATTGTALASVQPVNFVRFYYDTNVNASDLAGTGFADGTKILEGAATFFGGTFVEFTGFPPANFDNYGVNDYPGIKSNTGTGGALVEASITSTDPGFFISPPSVLGMNFSTTNGEPFNDTNPSQQFLGIPANVGAINGVSGPDIQVQADAAASFLVPEPGALALMGLVALALRRVRRHRR
ncbi:MAG: flocculation-associated PEP-CTERM protein PepA [Tepidisphaeraceae bacterium]|jgi:hypothetical protein